MNPWASLVGETAPRDIQGLPAHKHILADEIDHSKLAPAQVDASITEGRGPAQHTERAPLRRARAVNHWPLIGSATATEIKAAADRAWGRIGEEA